MQPRRLFALPPLALLALTLPLCIPPACPAAEKPLPVTAPETLGVSAARLAQIDGAVRHAMARGDMPGAVVGVVHRRHARFREPSPLLRPQPENSPLAPFC